MLLPNSPATPAFDSALKNHILNQLPASERNALLADAEYAVLRAGDTFARAGERIRSAFFPESGVISSISQMATGHQVTIALIGAEGLLGMEPILGVAHHPHGLVVLLESEGHRLDADRFCQVFQESQSLRAVVLAHIGRAMNEIATVAACTRVHAHRQRLARWLLVTTDKAQRASLPVTHDALAQMVGGPRHAVTVALNELRAQGAIAHRRGHIDVLDRSVLMAHACECYPEIVRPAQVTT
jgi:CRP-like cAMP-binding protein